MSLFYDNSTDHVSAEVPLSAVERVYCLQFSDFTDADFTHLEEVYRRLPGWQGFTPDGLPSWFGFEGATPFLHASVEPSGLQLVGILTVEDWQAWDDAFRLHLPEFPTFDV